MFSCFVSTLELCHSAFIGEVSGELINVVVVEAGIKKMKREVSTSTICYGPQAR